MTDQKTEATVAPVAKKDTKPAVKTSNIRGEIKPATPHKQDNKKMLVKVNFVGGTMYDPYSCVYIDDRPTQVDGNKWILRNIKAGKLVEVK